MSQEQRHTHPGPPPCAQPRADRWPDADSPETAEILRLVEKGDRQALDRILSRHRPRLRRMVDLRLHQRVRGRIDASDVVQDSLLEASRRLAEYLRDPPMPFFLWLRFLTRQRLVALHRHHLGTKARDPRREVSLYGGATPEASTEALAAQLLGHRNTPSEEVARVEMQLRLQDALNGMDPIDREVLALRHFEQLGNAEAAREMGIGEAAASKRYVRALYKLRGILTHLKLDEIHP